MYKKYYSYNDMPLPITQQKPTVRQECEPPVKKAENVTASARSGGLLAGLSTDDLILAAVLFILLMDNCEDKLLLAAIGFILLGDK